MRILDFAIKNLIQLGRALLFLTIVLAVFFSAMLATTYLLA
jgi:hypothetical protein